jgi:hypothetical protein
VTLRLQLSAQVTRADAGLHADQARWQVGKPCPDLAAGLEQRFRAMEVVATISSPGGLARWLKARGIEVHVIHASSVAVSFQIPRGDCARPRRESLCYSVVAPPEIPQAISPMMARRGRTHARDNDSGERR